MIMDHIPNQLVVESFLPFNDLTEQMLSLINSGYNAKALATMKIIKEQASKLPGIPLETLDDFMFHLPNRRRTLDFLQENPYFINRRLENFVFETENEIKGNSVRIIPSNGFLNDPRSSRFWGTIPRAAIDYIIKNRQELMEAVIVQYKKDTPEVGGDFNWSHHNTVSPGSSITFDVSYSINQYCKNSAVITFLVSEDVLKIYLHDNIKNESNFLLNYLVEKMNLSEIEYNESPTKPREEEISEEISDNEAVSDYIDREKLAFKKQKLAELDARLELVHRKLESHKKAILKINSEVETFEQETESLKEKRIAIEEAFK